MSYHKKWIKDLGQGEIGEKVFAKYLKIVKDFEIVKFNKDYRYDIVTNYFSKMITFEVKTDRWELRKGRVTNNIFIETLCNGRLSGISTTEADVFVYFFPDWELAYLISVKKLKELILTRGDHFIRADKSGDGQKVTGYLIDRIKYGHLFKVYKIPKARIWAEIEPE